MNIVKKVREIKIGDEDYIMTFDMRSIAVFKELTGKSFLQSSAKLGLLDDEVVLGFIGATLRKVNEENKPLGSRYMIWIFLNLSETVIELVTSSLPQSKPSDKGVKKSITRRYKFRFLILLLYKYFK